MRAPFHLDRATPAEPKLPDGGELTDEHLDDTSPSLPRWPNPTPTMAAASNRWP